MNDTGGVTERRIRTYLTKARTRVERAYGAPAIYLLYMIFGPLSFLPVRSYQLGSCQETFFCSILAVRDGLASLANEMK